MSSSSLRVLRSLLTERLTAAVEEILGLVERVMVEHEAELIRRYRPAEGSRSPDTEPPRSRSTSDVRGFDSFDIQLQSDEEQLESPTIKQEREEEQEEEEEWRGLKDQAVVRQIKVEQDTEGFTYVLESEQPLSDSPPPDEILKVELKDEDFLPSTSSSSDARLMLDPRADLAPPAAAQNEIPGSSSTSCKVCGKKFSYCGFLIKHAEIHADNENCLCGVCGKPLPDRGNLLEHLQTHIKPHVCQACGKSFRKQTELEEHTRCHTGERPFSCRICGKTCSRKRNLLMHMRTHTGEKPYSCSVCGRCFNVTSALIRHSRTHTGEKPYNCDFCFKAFASSSEMKIHLRTHTGEKPFKCNVCSRSFTLSTRLKNHMKHHTEEHPYYCNVCSKSFCDVYVLRRHMKTHNKDTT